MKRWMLVALGAALLVAVGAGAQTASRAQKQQKLDNLDRGRAEDMLRAVYETVKKHYYDPKFHGVDIDARFKEYDNRIKQAQNLEAAFTDIAAYLSALHDSHTFFQPPSLTFRFDYGFRMQMIGDQAFVTEVRPDSDATEKLHSGDQILSLGRFQVNRGDYPDLEYFLRQLWPQPQLRLVVRSPEGNARDEIVRTKFIQEKQLMDLSVPFSPDMWHLIRQIEGQDHLTRDRWVDIGDTMIWKMPEFFMSDAEMDDMMARARKHSALILDLRGNPGGSTKVLENLIGFFFDHEVTIATRQTRKEEKPWEAKTKGKKAFNGKLFVLIDSLSASAAELFAKTIQLEHRGVIIGDRSQGAVMESQFYPLQMGQGTLVFYGVAVAHADLIMPDGKSLEHVGVTPDVVVLPTNTDLALGRDPALSRAATLAGEKLDPEAAGKLFPFEWAPLR
jgi:C-terminal processing protease CtpA/Prc